MIQDSDLGFIYNKKLCKIWYSQFILFSWIVSKSIWFSPTHFKFCNFVGWNYEIYTMCGSWQKKILDNRLVCLFLYFGIGHILKLYDIIYKVRPLQRLYTKLLVA